MRANHIAADIEVVGIRAVREGGKEIAIVEVVVEKGRGLIVALEVALEDEEAIIDETEKEADEGEEIEVAQGVGTATDDEETQKRTKPKKPLLPLALPLLLLTIPKP